MVSVDTARQSKDSASVRVVCEMFLRRCATECRPKTFASHQDMLTRFCDAIDPEGLFPCSSLTLHMVRDWLASTARGRENEQGRIYSWGSATRAIAVRSIRAAFRWAVRDELLSRNPVEGLSAPKTRSRGREYLLGRTPEERQQTHQRILAACPKAFRPFVVCLEATGARPGELAAATARDYDPELGAIVYHSDDTRLEGEFEHKTSRHGKERTIILTGEAKMIVEGLVAKHPIGPLFRTSKGGQWTPRTIARYFIRIRRKLNLPRLSAYTYRHTLATAFLEQGRSVELLAAILGNSPEVIRRHYSHLLGDTSNLRRQLEAFKNAAGGSETPAMEPIRGAASGSGEEE